MEKKLTKVETVTVDQEIQKAEQDLAILKMMKNRGIVGFMKRDEQVSVPAHPITAGSKGNDRKEYLRSSQYTRKDYAEIRSHILAVAAQHESFKTKDVWKYLRKATRFTSAKKSQIYWQLKTMSDAKDLIKVGEGAFSLPKEG